MVISMRKLLFLVLFTSSVSLAGEVALTFDDAPRGDGLYFKGPERTEQLIRKLKAADVSAAFFCNTRDLTREGLVRLRSYADAGHIIANHTHSHPDLNKVGPEEFIREIQKAHSILAGISTFRPWLRFPYLHEGKDIPSRDAVRTALVKLAYTNAYVTIRNSDWLLDALFQEALQQERQIDLEKLKKVYLTILWAGIELYDTVAIKILGRSPKHVLLLHENDLAALFIDDLIQLLRDKGGRVISPDEAYRDPLAKMTPSALRLNWGRIAALAMDNAYPGPLLTRWDDKELRNLVKDEEVFH